VYFPVKTKKAYTTFSAYIKTECNYNACHSSVLQRARTWIHGKLRRARFSAYYFYQYNVFLVMGDLGWKGKTINTEYVASTAVNAQTGMEE
jgi:hypothetical protein